MRRKLAARPSGLRGAERGAAAGKLSEGRYREWAIVPGGPFWPKVS
jgi:hypothetical protein